MNAADDKAESTDSSVVKMPKRKSKNRKQNQQQSQGLSSAATKKNLPTEKTIVAGGAAAIAMNGDGSGSLELISQELDNSLHIKENGCMANHIIRNNEQHQSNNIDRTENTPNKSENALHAEIIIENHHHQQQQEQQSSLKQGSESQGSKKSNFLENGDVSPSLKKLKQSTSVAPSTSSSTKFKVNGNNNNIKIEKVERTCMAVLSSSESIMQMTPSVEGTQKSSITQKKIDDRNESENSNNSNCQGHDDDTNVVITTRTTQNSALSSSNNCERLSNNSRRTVDEVTSLPKDIEAVESAQSSTAPVAVNGIDPSNIVIEYKEYESELQMQDIMRLIQTELSEPYSIYTYRYFIYNWPKLCFLAAHGNEYVGAIVCKLDMHMNVKRGYIAMLAVKKEYRKLKIGTTLVQKAIEAMLADDADEVVLETEMKNIPALRLYENLGFVRDKRLFRYYLNGVDALRLKLWFR